MQRRPLQLLQEYYSAYTQRAVAARPMYPLAGTMTLTQKQIKRLKKSQENQQRTRERLRQIAQESLVRRPLPALERYRGKNVRTESVEYLTEGVAEVILKQIKASMNMIDYLGMGMKNVFSFKQDQEFIGTKATGPGVQFDVRGHWKGRVIIRLSPGDTYTIIFGRVRKKKGTPTWIVDKEIAGIYADQLGTLLREYVLGNKLRK